MEIIKKILKTLFCLPLWPTLALAASGYGLVLSVAAFHIQNPVVVYAAYLASAYALVITATGLPHLSRAWQRGRAWFARIALARKVRSSPTGQKYLTDVHFRNIISLYIGLTINLAYIVLKLASGIYYRSAWFIALAVYYILLAVMRLSLLRTHAARGEAAELRVYRRCGYVLLLMNQALMGIVVFMVHENRGFRYPGLLIYAMAAYSFYAVITASVNVGRTRRHQSPLLSATKAVNLVAALVSILSLTTAMLAQFGGEDDMTFRKTMTGLVGVGSASL